MPRIAEKTGPGTYVYHYPIEDLGRAVQITLDYFKSHPEMLEAADESTGLKIAQALDDATDASDEWSQKDVVFAMRDESISDT